MTVPDLEAVALGNGLLMSVGSSREDGVHEPFESGGRGLVGTSLGNGLLRFARSARDDGPFDFETEPLDNDSLGEFTSVAWFVTPDDWSEVRAASRMHVQVAAFYD